MWPQFRSCEHSGFENMDQSSSSPTKATRGPVLRLGTPDLAMLPASICGEEPAKQH